ncbi:MAG: hypothetical protein SFW09_11335 [Hyphomicrobiaceae bacterium]|nr:hypothetical protein [Hyphomicrobiaceae bacterium]
MKGSYMRILLALSLAAALGTAAAIAQTGSQTQPAPQSDTGNPAVKDPAPNSDKNASSPPASTGTGTGTSGVATPVPLTALESGSNSFTEGQARSRLQDAGFGNITGLAKDDNGIWRGKAQKGGRTVTVGLDYKGNIGSE